MIKDLVVNLEQQAARDPARDFAISVAKTFGAHIAGVSFAFVPDFPGYISPQLRPEMFAEVMARSEEVALAAIDRFEAAADQSQVSKEHRMLKAKQVDAPLILSALARRFDL